MRIGRHQLFIEIARTFSKRSTCFRLNVGAVITCDNRTVSCGYNGALSGQPHCDGDDCPLSESGACTRAIHAEINAIERIPTTFIYNAKLRLYVTDSPCNACAKIIVETPSIFEVYFETLYRIKDPVKYMVKCGLGVFKVTPSGYIIDQRTEKIIEDA